MSKAPTVLSVDQAELPTQDLSTPDCAGSDQDSSAEATRDIPPSRATLEATAGTTGYELLDQIGRGGMGLIHRAYQRCLERDVAVKRIRKRRDGSASVREQFVFEALTTGYLDHPNIVPVHELGRAESGELFMAMKLVEGVSWAALLEPRNDAQRELAQKYQPEDHLELLITVGHALAFAHSRGIVHRDLKPENVMIGPFGEVLVMDWGIALDFRDEPDPPCRAPHCSTARGPAGTPSYMAPEQAEGRGECIGPPTDIYQLGAILHELLTGKPPHRGASVYAALLSATRAARPELPSEVPEELAAVCRRALEKEPGDRYPDVAAMQEALRTYLRHTESHTIARSALETLAQCEEQASALVGSFTSSVSLAPRTEAEEDAQDAETSRPQGLYARFAEAVAGFHQSQLLWPGNPDAARGERRARLAFAEAARRAGDFGLAAAQLEALPAASVLRAKVEAARLAREENERRERRLRRGFYITALLLVAALSIGFALVKAAERRTAHERDEARAARASAEISEWHARLEAARNLYDRSFRFTDDNRIGEAMACLLRAVEIAPPGAAPENFPTAWDQPGWAEASWLRLRLLDYRRARATDVLDHGDWVRALATSDGLGLVLTGSDDGDVRVVDVTPSEDGQADDPVRYRLEGPGGFVYALAIGPGSVHFAAGTGDGLVRVWRRAARRSEEGRPREVAPRLVATVKLSSNAVRALGFLPDDTLVAGLDDGTLRFVDVSAGRELAERRLTAHPGGVRALTIREHQVISGGADQTALQLDTTTGETRRLSGHTGWVTSVAIAP
ncbi:MAG: WD40 repeat domain-containing serine/threonine protein kinase, partial [Planctomycetota bacterium]